MPKHCSFGGCTNHHLQEGKKLSFFRFPDADREPERRRCWIWACARKNHDGSEWLPTAKYVYVCSEHFCTGQPRSDPNHPDYVPSLMKRTPRTVQKGDKKIKRYASAAKRKLTLQDPRPMKEQKLEDEKSEESDSQSQGSMDNQATCDVSMVDLHTPGSSENASTGYARALETSERQQLFMEIENLKKEKAELARKLDNTEQLLKRVQLSSASVVGNDDKCKFYTGLSWSVFAKTFEFLHSFLPPVRPGSLPARDQFFLTLIKLRQDPNFEYLADQTGVGETTIRDYFWKWINLMEAKLGFLLDWPDRETIRQTIPPIFKSKFPRLTNIIDCFEIFIEQPKNLKARAQCYSHYKKHTTVKFLIACSPLGSVVFLSRAWGGRVSDVELTRTSGYISSQLHHPGDQILADRGFTLQEDMATVCSAELILPAFTRDKKQLSARDVEVSRSLASVRIHIERVIGLVKNRFAILQGTLPLHLVNSPRSEIDGGLSNIDKIVRVCAILTNLGEGIVYKN